MADATSVSYRKGTSTDHEVFRGTLGEITVDTTDSTVWIHLGNDQKGTPLARADLKNVSNDAKTSAGLAQIDLNNVIIPNSTVAATVRTRLAPLGYALADMSNMNTKSLATGRSGASGDKDLAYADASNLDTTSLVEKVVESNAFVKADMSNAQTSLLATDTSLPAGEKPLAYADLSNVGSEALAGFAKNDLSNITTLSTTTLNSLHSKRLQITDKLVAVDQATATDEYPTALSVKAALEECAKLPELPAASSENKLTLFNAFKYSYNITCDTQGTGYSQNDIITISGLKALVKEIDSDGKIINAEQIDFYGKEEKQGSGIAAIGGTGTGATFSISSNEVLPNGLEWSVIESQSIAFSNENGTSGYFIPYNLAVGDIYTTRDALETLGLNQQQMPGKQTLARVGFNAPEMTISLDATKTIYFVDATANTKINIQSNNIAGLTVGMAKTFEIHIKCNNTVPNITWGGIDKWLKDSETSPLEPNMTSIFTIRVQTTPSTDNKTVIANYGGAY